MSQRVMNSFENQTPLMLAAGGIAIANPLHNPDAAKQRRVERLPQQRFVAVDRRQQAAAVILAHYVWPVRPAPGRIPARV